MVKSKNCSFEVKILQKANEQRTEGDLLNASYEPLKELITPLGVYVIASPDQEFVIELKANDNNVYGAKLWIDDQEIHYKKTFKTRGFFMGFKLGEGRFQSFKFAPPSYETHDSSGKLATRSEIRVEFYKTTERYLSEESIVNRSFKKNYEYVPGVVKENKKFFRKSLTVKAGEVIYKPGLDKSELLHKLRDRKTKKYREDVIDYNSVLDSVTIHYGDFNSLLVQGVVSLANYDHLNAVPIIEVQKKPKIVERLLMTVIRKYAPNGLTLQQIEEEFCKIFGSFESLEVGPLVTFISLRHQLFQLENNCLKCSETAKNIYLDLRDLDPDNGIVPPTYFKTGQEMDLVNRNEEPSYKFNPWGTPKKDKPQQNGSKGNAPIMIDLTQD